MRRQQQQGVALVVTLILLSVITFTAITFLVISRSEKGAVSTSTDQTVAKLASEAGVERIQGEILSSILTETNPFAYDLTVTTNYINPAGFIAGNGDSLTNVSYTYPNGSTLSSGDQERNIANLFFDPRPPVYIFTNKAQTGKPDFRYFLDLNRNGRFEPSGMQPVVGNSGYYLDTNGVDTSEFYVEGVPPAPGNYMSNFTVGDPQWIGVLEHPDQPHSASNRFVARYATVLVPSGKTLDLNRIHNLSTIASVSHPFSGNLNFGRNMGVGTWEVNLAAFLTDLNTNLWEVPGRDYNYSPVFNPTAPSVNFTYLGDSFFDAANIISYRYQPVDGFGVRSFSTLYPAEFPKFEVDQIDGYGAGPFMNNINVVPEVLGVTGDSTRASRPWPGDDNPQHYFSPEDLFDANKVGVDFVERLSLETLPANLGTNSTYNRTTFYRLLSQLGTDGGLENRDKININYDNKVQRNADGAANVTNFYTWKPLDFFEEAADNLLREYQFDHFRRSLDPAFGDGYAAQNNLARRIPIMTNGVFVYTPSVHRLLQLAANIYDATWTTNESGLSNYPSVFRPVVEALSDNDVYITGWVEVDDTNGDNFRRVPPKDPLSPNERRTIQPGDNVYGVPWIIGAKKGFPNFNELSLDSVFTITRKLEMRKRNALLPPIETNQLFTASITNAVGVEAWNSYRTDFNRLVDIYCTNQMRVYLTLINRPNNLGTTIQFTNYASPRLGVYSVPNWPGTGTGPGAGIIPKKQSFGAVIATNIPILTNSIFRANGVLDTNLTPGFVRSTVNQFPIPDIYLSVTNLMQFAMVDRGTGRILDYVHLRIGMETNVTRKIADPPGRKGYAGLWSTKRTGGNEFDIGSPPEGVINQIKVSRGQYGISGNTWRNYRGSAEQAADKFRSFLTGQRMSYPPYTVNTNLVAQLPFSPSKRIQQSLSWQANDPLVHYTAGDLAAVAQGDGDQDLALSLTPQILENIGRVNDRYQPWGGNPDASVQTGTRGDLRYDTRYKDASVRSSDNWDFPTNKFPNVGWLGRVHRGTPWQTVYMKAGNISLTAGRFARKDWREWTGNANRFDAGRTVPQEDYKLFDLFTAALSDNATAGQMSVNQEGLAAWSAILSGVIVLTNTTPEANLIDFDPTAAITNEPRVIPPAGIDHANSALWRIVQGINSDRAREPNQVFNYAGDVLKAEELTVESPFLNLSDTQRENGITDAMYERIPQQIMGLLRGKEQPRYVVYSYGQSLKPAERSLITSGSNFGLCTNYQITAEAAVRAVIQVEDAPDNPTIQVESFNLLPPD